MQGIETLSERERQILTLIAQGHSNKEMAGQLHISPNTVKVHVRNVYAKLGVTSRSEATLCAVRAGIVNIGRQTEAPVSEEIIAIDETKPAPAPESAPPAPAEHEIPPDDTTTDRRPPRRLLWVLLLGLLLLLLALAFAAGRSTPPPATEVAETAVPTTPASAWETRASLSTPRSNLAVVSYENLIYAVGGQTAQGVTNALASYSPTADEWTSLAPKPIPVADIQAAVIGGRIYVPGGRLEDGAITAELEIYDPARNLWVEGAPVPAKRSAYSLVAFEGQLYLFGGWDGHSYQNTVYRYDPLQDQWLEQTPMPTARGFSGAAVVENKIYVLGGTDGTQVLDANEEYIPTYEGTQTPWAVRSPIPGGRAYMGAASIIGKIYVVGGLGQDLAGPSLAYSAPQDQWQSFGATEAQQRDHLGLVVIGTDLHLIGGLKNEELSPEHLAYKAIYTIAIPIIR